MDYPPELEAIINSLPPLARWAVYGGIGLATAVAYFLALRKTPAAPPSPPPPDRRAAELALETRARAAEAELLRAHMVAELENFRRDVVAVLGELRDDVSTSMSATRQSYRDTQVPVTEALARCERNLAILLDRRPRPRG